MAWLRMHLKLSKLANNTSFFSFGLEDFVTVVLKQCVDIADEMSIYQLEYNDYNVKWIISAGSTLHF